MVVEVNGSKRLHSKVMQVRKLDLLIKCDAVAE